MAFVEDVKAGINRAVNGGRYKNLTQMSEKIKVSQAILWKMLNGQSNPRLDVVGRILDALGAKIVFPEENKDRKKNCVFINAKRSPAFSEASEIEAENYKAIPLVEGAVAAGPGMIPQEGIKSWFLIYDMVPSVRFRQNLLAVEVGSNQHSMEPMLHPGDIVLVDLDDKNASSGTGIFLVRDPDGQGAIKRVKLEARSGKTAIMFYSDNVNYPPYLYYLEDDYEDDIGKAIVGRVVWQWSDSTKK